MTMIHIFCHIFSYSLYFYINIVKKYEHFNQYDKQVRSKVSKSSLIILPMMCNVLDCVTKYSFCHVIWIITISNLPALGLDRFHTVVRTGLWNHCFSIRPTEMRNNSAECGKIICTQLLIARRATDLTWGSFRSGVQSACSPTASQDAGAFVRSCRTYGVEKQTKSTQNRGEIEPSVTRRLRNHVMQLLSRALHNRTKYTMSYRSYFYQSLSGAQKGLAWTSHLSFK